MYTRLTELLQIQYPILQGAMAWISESRLAAAVSNAGGAGIIATGGRSVDWVALEIRLAKMLTEKPFGVNVVLNDPNRHEVVEKICREKPAFVTMGAGNPLPFILQLKKAGIKVIPIVPSVKLARRVEEAGADGIIIEGMESGGHVGYSTTMALLTNVVPEVSIPVISAGGIADGRGLAAALIMGASGVQMGSRFLLAEECIVHVNVKKKIISASDNETVVTGYLSGHGGVRGLKNQFTEKYLELEKSGVQRETLDALAQGRNRLSSIDGDMENGSVQVGQSLTPLAKIQYTNEIIKEVNDEAVKALKNGFATYLKGEL